MGQAFPQSLSGGRRDRGAAAIRAGRFRSQRVGGALPQAGPDMSQVRSRDGTTIGYDRLGAGPPVILVDGAFCSRAFGPMPKLAPRLARDFTVFMYDRRGRGGSGGPAPYAVARGIGDLHPLVPDAGGPRFVCATSSRPAPCVRGGAQGLSRCSVL